MTSPFKVIRGSDRNLNEFEKAISEALSDGYDLAGDLVVAHGGGETVMFQTLVQDDDDDDDDDDYDYDEEEDDEDEDEEEEADDYSDDDDDDFDMDDDDDDSDFDYDEDDE